MFCERLRELRMRHGYSQSELAKAIGVERTRYNKWETTRSEPSFTVLVQIADFFNVTTDYLLGRTDTPTGYVLQNEKLPTELVDSGVESITRAGGPDLSEREIEALRKMLAERPDLR